MAKRGRKATGELSLHKKTGQFYKLVNGNRKYFGTDKGEAYRRWHEFEATRLIEAANNGQAIAKPSPGVLAEAPDSLTLRVRSGPPTPTTPVQVEAVTCQQVIDLYLSGIKKVDGKQHYLDAKNRSKRWLKHIGKATPIHKLTPEDFDRFRGGLLKQYRQRMEWEAKQPKPISIKAKRTAPGMAGSSVIKLLGMVTKAFKDAAEAGFELPDYVRCMKNLRRIKTRDEKDPHALTLKIAKQETPIFTRDEVQKILDKLDTKWRALFCFALNISGSNIDVAEAPWSCIRWDLNTIEYERGKNGHIRRFPLWASTREYLEDWQKECPSVHYIFTTCHGQPFISFGPKGKNRKDSLGQQWRQKLDSDELKIKLPHPFSVVRKSVPSVAAACGANELTIKMLLGDAPNEIWRSYAQALPETITKAMTAVAEYYGLKP